MTARHCNRPRRHAARGVSLIELLVALTIGSLLIIGAVTVYMQSRNTYRTNETAARLQEVARYALDTIEPDVRLAGFWGLTNHPEFVDNTGTAATPQQAVDLDTGKRCGTNFTVDTVAAVDARDATATGGPGFNFPATCGSTVPAPTPVAWSDVLIVRRASSDTVAPELDRMQVQSNRMRATIFSDGAVPTLYDAASSETRNLVVHIYYVSDQGLNARGVRQYSLRVKTLVKGATQPTMQDEEVVPGVEDLQVQFGIDNAPRDGNIERYVNPGAVPAGARIASVRVWLRILGEEREIGFTDSQNRSYANANFGVLGGDRRRVLVSKTIQLRNSPI